MALAFAASMKIGHPIEKAREDQEEPGATSLVGSVEIQGASGLTLPAATKIAPWLTPLAAAGLVLTMLVAIVVYTRLNQT
ncbi:MAG TPA: DoxX family protein [Ktedonobacteraceae bacterium]